MKLNKRIMSLGLAAAMTVPMAGCGGGSKQEAAAPVDLPTIDSITLSTADAPGDYTDLTASIKVLTNRTDIVDTVYKGYAEQIQVVLADQKEVRRIEDRDENGIVEFELPRRLPKAFVCNCDLVAGMLVSKLNARGLKVPDGVSVVGFDNFLYPGYADMKITTYEVNTKAMVRVAIKKLMKQFKNPGSGRGLEIVSGHVVLKNSVRRQ